MSYPVSQSGTNTTWHRTDEHGRVWRGTSSSEAQGWVGGRAESRNVMGQPAGIAKGHKEERKTLLPHSPFQIPWGEEVLCARYDSRHWSTPLSNSLSSLPTTMSFLGLALGVYTHHLAHLNCTRSHDSEFRADMLTSLLSLKQWGSGIGEFPKKARAVSGQGELGEAEWKLCPVNWTEQ